MEYHAKINNTIALHITDYDPDVSWEREALVGIVLDKALSGDDLLYRQLAEYIEHALDLAGAVRKVLYDDGDAGIGSVE